MQEKLYANWYAERKDYQHYVALIAFITLLQGQTKEFRNIVSYDWKFLKVFFSYFKQFLNKFLKKEKLCEIIHK